MISRDGGRPSVVPSDASRAVRASCIMYGGVAEFQGAEKRFPQPPPRRTLDSKADVTSETRVSCIFIVYTYVCIYIYKENLTGSYSWRATRVFRSKGISF